MNQSQALDILKTGTNVFLTGEPGSGKTYTVNSYIAYLKAHQIPVAITASTGIAATHLGGMTIHSWSGIQIRKNLTVADLEYLKKQDYLVVRALKTQVLIIDEISMLDAETLDAVDQAARALRDRDESFGGMQVILVGDFFQLPPVRKDSEGNFAYRSRAWQEAKLAVCYLDEQHRQSDREFLRILHKIRTNSIDYDLFEVLESRHTQQTQNTSHSITRLYSHNQDVDQINHHRLAGISAAMQTFEMTSRGHQGLVEQLTKSCLSPHIFNVKVGAKVMFTKNSFEQGFVNGTIGEVTGFDEDLPVVQTREGKRIQVRPVDWEINDGFKSLASITQLPLRLAWAITIHKSQGMSLDEAIMDLSKTFEYGQGYVAISRVRTLRGLYLLGMNQRALEVHPEILEIDTQLQKLSALAEQELTSFTQEQLIENHDRFIVKCGGRLEKKIETNDTQNSNSTYEKTYELFTAGKTVSSIAKERGYTEGTILHHLEKLKEQHKLGAKELLRVVPAHLVAHMSLIHTAFDTMEEKRYKPVFDYFNGKYSYDDLKMARLVYEEK